VLLEFSITHDNYYEFNKSEYQYKKTELGLTYIDDNPKVCFTYSKLDPNKSFLLVKEKEIQKEIEFNVYQMMTNQTTGDIELQSLIKLPVSNKPGAIETTANDEFLIISRFSNNLQLE